jgi:hypothetical protein
MDEAAAKEILDDVFGDRVDIATPTWSGQVQLWFSIAPSSASMHIYQGGEEHSGSNQPIALLPAADVDEDRYRAFAEGVRAGMGAHIARYEGWTSPREFFLVDLLRDPSLRSAADFAEAVDREDVQTRSLAPIQLGDFAAAHGLAVLTDEAAARHVWTVFSESRAGVAAARALVDDDVRAAIPYIVAKLEHWVERGYAYQAEWIVDGANGHAQLARILERLLRRTTDPELVRRIDALAEAGFFGADEP